MGMGGDGDGDDGVDGDGDGNGDGDATLMIPDCTALRAGPPSRLQMWFRLTMTVMLNATQRTRHFQFVWLYVTSLDFAFSRSQDPKATIPWPRSQGLSGRRQRTILLDGFLASRTHLSSH